MQKDFLNKLRDFGLNTYESKIWTALLSRGVSTAGELSDIANVPRSRSYDVLESLEKKGFILMKPGKPIKYIAVKPEEVIDRVKKKVTEETEKQIELIESLKTAKILDELNVLHTQGLDLVELDPNAKPPVCKIVDYGKYKYMLQKKQHESKKHQIVVHIKEIKIRPNIDEHDIEFKLRHVKRFLGDKDKVKVTVQFRGREIQHVERGMDVLKRFIKETEDVGQIDTPPKLEGKSMSMILSPLK